MNHWLKDVFLDIVILGLVASYFFSESEIVLYILWGYTGLLFLGKLFVLFTPFLKQRADKTQAPLWFYHVIYLATITILLLAEEYYLGVTWVLVWVFSIIPTIKRTKKAT